MSLSSSSGSLECRVDIHRRLHEGLHAVEHLLVIELADGRGEGERDLVAVHADADTIRYLHLLDVLQVARVPGVEHLEDQRVHVAHVGVLLRHFDRDEELLEGDVAGSARVQRKVLLGRAADLLEELVDLLAVLAEL